MFWFILGYFFNFLTHVSQILVQFSLILIQFLFNFNSFTEPFRKAEEIMEAVDQSDKVLMRWMEEWDELGLDLVINCSALMPAPVKESIYSVM